MNYTKQVREYCETHANVLIDISVVRDSVFEDIPYKTLLKIFNRLKMKVLYIQFQKGYIVQGKKQ